MLRGAGRTSQPYSHFRQYAAVKTTSTMNISGRPNSIANVLAFPQRRSERITFLRSGTQIL